MPQSELLLEFLLPLLLELVLLNFIEVTVDLDLFHKHTLESIHLNSILYQFFCSLKIVCFCCFKTFSSFFSRYSSSYFLCQFFFSQNNFVELCRSFLLMWLRYAPNGFHHVDTFRRRDFKTSTPWPVESHTQNFSKHTGTRKTYICVLKKNRIG